MPVPVEYEVLNPDGSVNYKASLLNWIGSLNDPLFKVNSDLDTFIDWWGQLTTPQKTAIKTLVVNHLEDVRTKASEIITEINGL